VRPNVLNPLSVMYSTLTKMLSMTWMRFPTSNTLKTSQTWSLNYYHLLCQRWKHTRPPGLCCAFTLQFQGNATPRVALRRTYKTISTTRLRQMKSSNIRSVGSRWRAWRCTMTTCWMKKTPLCVSQASKMAMASRSSWLARGIYSRLGSGNSLLSKIWDGMTTTNALS